jgi:hypothetical protein
MYMYEQILQLYPDERIKKGTIRVGIFLLKTANRVEPNRTEMSVFSVFRFDFGF